MNQENRFHSRHRHHKPPAQLPHDLDEQVDVLFSRPPVHDRGTEGYPPGLDGRARVHSPFRQDPLGSGRSPAARPWRLLSL